MISASGDGASPVAQSAAEGRRRALWSAGVAHALHDGYTDVIYVLLPVWQAEFGLGYGALALLRSLYSGTMAALQVPAGRLAERFGGRTVLVLGTALTGLGYGAAGLSGGLIGLCLALLACGAGAATQHPIGAAAVSRAYGADARTPLGTFNFSGDVGKAAVPALTALLLMVVSWRGALALLGAAALLVAAGLMRFMPPVAAAATGPAPAQAGQEADQEAGRKPGKGRGGFPLLLAIGMLDTGVRMGLLTFLPFLLQEKGAALPTIGTALALLFLGGAAGKFACGWLGARIGVLATVLITEGATALGILGVLALPLAPCLVLLPLLGMVLNGTSSVLYGTVPELAPAHQTERAFALFYTGTIGSGAVSPVAYGIVGDLLGAHWATAAIAVAALATCPLAMLLAPRLGGRPSA